MSKRILVMSQQKSSVLVSVLAFIGFAVGFGYKQYQDDKRAVMSTKTFSSGSGVVHVFDYDDTSPSQRPVADSEVNAALDRAVLKWSVATGQMIKRPVLLRDDKSAGCGLDLDGAVIACADLHEYRIFVRALFYADPETVMMHEVGHLLGVPHVAGDALMDSVYDGPVERPTDVDVAIANAVLAKRPVGPVVSNEDDN